MRGYHLGSDDLMAKDGKIAATLPGFVPRSQQVEACRSIEAAMDGMSDIALIEAGTGVGKTLAYLLPAVSHASRDFRVVISTHTLALQAQLWEKDLPMVLGLTKSAPKAALLKGRGNYLCISHLVNARSEMSGVSDPLFDRLVAWSQETETGDVADLDFAYPSWHEIRAESDSCRGKECAFYNDCFLYRARKMAEDASIIVVNHALFFADLDVRLAEPDAALLPEYKFVIFDEAHHMEDTATNAFSTRVTSGSLAVLMTRIRRMGTLAGIDEALLHSIEGEWQRFFGAWRLGRKTEQEWGDLADDDRKTVAASTAILGPLLETLGSHLKVAETKPPRKERCEALARQTSMLRETIEALALDDDGNSVLWASLSEFGRSRQTSVTVQRAPISVAPLLSKNIWERPRNFGCIAVSATLAVNKSFDYFKLRSGINLEPDHTLIAESPFDYRTNCQIYLPRHLPPPSDSPEYASLLANEAVDLVCASRGGAFLLFTSRKMMLAVAAQIEHIGMRLPMMVQGQLPTQKILDIFKSSGNSVLLATMSFWEGVDVPGDALRLVMIDKLPFAMPDSPLHRARTQKIVHDGGDWFRDYALPQAQLRLKQGFGRLIRTMTDRGVVGIMDSRLTSKGYGGKFLASLPPAQRVYTVDEVAKFFNK